MPKRSIEFCPFQAIGPVIGTMFYFGVMLGLLAPESMGWLAGWLLILPALIIGIGLAMAVASSVIGHFLR